jgi:UDPglucose 6-dehydrogenase
MKLAYIGGGFVGTCSAAVSADSGHEVLVFDIDEKKISLLGSGDRGVIESCLYEEGLGDLIVRNKHRIRFTTDRNELAQFLDNADAVFMCLPTPEIGETGESNLTFYMAAAREVGAVLAHRNSGEQSHYVVVVNKSTVPIDMINRTGTVLEEVGVKNFGVVSNPEFLVEGKAVKDSLKPDRVVIGAEFEKDFKIMRQIYQRFYDSPTVQYIEVAPEEAEAGKLLANFYLFNKLAICFDVIGRTCEAFPGLRFENLRRVLTSDERIGGWGFYDSLYAGGSCFIKDARSLSYQLQTKGYNAVLVNETYLANKRQLELFLSRAEKEALFEWKNKNVAILGLAFKRDSNDIRNSPSIEIVRFLLEKQVKKICVYDPVAQENFKNIFSKESIIEYILHEFDAVNDVDVIIIATDWPQFRGLADSIILELKNRPLIMDGRRMLQHRYEDLVRNGFSVIAVGSPFYKAIL